MDKELGARRWYFFAAFGYFEWALVLGAFIAFYERGVSEIERILISGLAVALFVFYVSYGVRLVERIRFPSTRWLRIFRNASYLMYPFFGLVLILSACPLGLDMTYLRGYPAARILRAESVGAIVLTFVWLVAFNRWHASLKALEHEGESYVARSPTGGPGSVGTRRSSTSDRIDSQRRQGR
jgi:hypothetical protein